MLSKQDLNICQQMIIHGYQLETKRLSNINTQCAHLEFSSIRLFIAENEKLIRLWTNFKGTNAKEQVILDKIYKLTGNGFCKQCSLYVVGNLKQNQFMSRITGDLNTSVSRKSLKQIANKQNYLVNCLQHPQIAYFIFHHTDLWVLMFNGLFGTMKEIQMSCKPKSHTNSTETLHIEYKKLALALFQILRNYHFLEDRHWMYLLDPKGCYFKRWIIFVKQQLECNIYVKDSFGLSVMYCMLLLLCIAFKNLEGQEWHKHDIDDWFEDIYSLSYKCSNGIGKCFLKLQFGRSSLYRKFEEWSYVVYKLKEDQMQCQRLKCKKIRVNNDNKLYK
eukprot:408954_1